MKIKMLRNIVFLWLLPITIFANTTAEEAAKQKQNFENQKEQFIRLQEKSDKKILFYKTQKPTIEGTTKGECFKTIKIIDDTIRLLNKKEKEKIYIKYLGKCNSIVDLKNLVNDLTSLYIDKGYITSKVYLKQQNIADGIVEVYAIEGKLENFIEDALWIDTAFFIQDESYLNLRDLEVGIENINRLSSNNAKLKLEPGSKTGYTKIGIENTPSNRVNGYISVNNYGQDITGKTQYSGNLNIDNPIGINDRLTFTYNTTQKHNQVQNSIGNTVKYSFPLGRFLSTFSYSRGKYQQLVESTFRDFKLRGKNRTYNFDAEYKLFHDKVHKVTLGSFINHYQTKTLLDDSKIETSTYNLSKAGVNIDYIFQGSTSKTTLSFEHTRGVNWFGDYNPTELDERFKKNTIDISFVKLLQPFTYSLDLHLQQSSDKLFSTDQISIGGPYSVRGYKKEGLSGNQGLYYKNELSYSFKEKLFNIFNSSVYLAVDGGHIKKQEDTTGGNLLGSAIGLRLNSSSFSFDSYFSKPLRTTDVQEHSNFIGLQLTYQF